MSTWAGAIIRVGGRTEFEAIAAAHGIDVEQATTPWILVECGTTYRTPAFVESLSRALETTVVAFSLQTAASVEKIEHWENGELLRKLEYSGDEGGWITQSGRAQKWERAYFFADDEGTGEQTKWPLNLPDDLSNEDVARYERAKAGGDASGIMDLVHGGSAWGLFRLCAHFGVDPRRPTARFKPPLNRKPYVVAAAIVVFLLGAFLLGALTR